MREGKVSNPRLTICVDNGHKPVVAFGWINPVREASWIVVDQPGFREVYPVSGGLSVRVSTIAFPKGVIVFHVAQYDRHGTLLIRKAVPAAIAN